MGATSRNFVFGTLANVRSPNLRDVLTCRLRPLSDSFSFTL